MYIRVLILHSVVMYSAPGDDGVFGTSFEVTSSWYVNVGCPPVPLRLQDQGGVLITGKPSV